MFYTWEESDIVKGRRMTFCGGVTFYTICTVGYKTFALYSVDDNHCILSQRAMSCSDMAKYLTEKRCVPE